MQEKQYIRLKNIEIDKRVYLINKYISMNKDPEKSCLIVSVERETNCYESDGLLFYRALQLALPQANIIVGKTDIGDDVLGTIIRDWNTYLINFYAAKGEKIEPVKTRTILNIEDINRIKRSHDIVIEHNKKMGVQRKKEEWKATRWAYSYQQYLNACHSISLDNSILHLITGLESLLVKGGESLSYKTSVNAALISADDVKERKEVYDLIKKIYNLRSKVVHGEVKDVISIMSKPDIEGKYFRLKKVLSDILLRTYEMKEDEIFNKIEDMIFNAPSF